MSDPENIIEGDGSWLFQYGMIDTTFWAPGTYSFDVSVTFAAVFDGALDYTLDIAGGFRLDVDLADTAGTSFSFTLISEPVTSTVLVMGGLTCLVRKRRLMLRRKRDRET